MKLLLENWYSLSRSLFRERSAFAFSFLLSRNKPSTLSSARVPTHYPYMPRYIDLFVVHLLIIFSVLKKTIVPTYLSISLSLEILKLLM